MSATACGTADTGGGFDDEVAVDLDATVEQWAAEAAAGGLVVRVEAPGAQRTMAAGPADVDGDSELSGDEAFRIGGITQMFTATVALQLAEHDRVDLDAPVAEVVPERAELFEHGDEITLRQLLGHAAGLSQEFDPHPVELYADVADGVATVACDDVARRDLLDYADGDALSQPGTDWEYSNTGFLVAGEVIEAVTDRPLEDVYREQILDPLSMDQTWLDCPEQGRGELAGGVHPPGLDDLPGQGDEPVDVTDLARYAGAAGGLVSTAEDLAVFATALFAGELFDDQVTLEAMLEPGPAPYYGLGVELDDGSGGDTIGHPGQLPGYHSRLAYDPERDIVIVALSNATPNPHRTPLATNAAHAVRDVLLRDQPD